MANPTWILTDMHALDIDPLNWKLHQRTCNKDGTPSDKWKVVGYYRDLGTLAQGLQNKLMLTDHNQLTMNDHVNVALEACERAISAMKGHMDTLGYDMKTLPARYATMGKPDE